MRTQVTVTRLRDIKLHVFRDRTGAKHVTGMTIHGALVIPTRLFWLALAELGSVTDAEFGNEYEIYKKCILSIGDRTLYFSISVDEDGNALLDDITDSTEPVDKQCALIRSMFAARRGALDAYPQAPSSAPRCKIGDPSRHEDRVDDGDWPLLATPREPSRDLWGWESFYRLPVDGTAIWIEGPIGTVKSSVN